MKNQTYALHFSRGLRGGVPIALGYLSVSFGFGIAAVNKGLSPLTALLISLTNLTSAGQVAGLDVIVAGGTLLEMALTQLTINLRYFLMSLSLSQKLSPGFTLPHRLLAAFGITDAALRQQAEQYAKQDLVFYAIVQAENLTITDSEYSTRILEYIEGSGATVAEFEAYYGRDKLIESMLWDKMLEVIYSAAVITK